MRSAYTQCWISSDKRGVETENILSVAAYKPGTVKNSNIFLEQKAKHYLDNFGLGWWTVFYDIPGTLAGSLQNLFPVSIATKEFFLELEPAISFFGGQEGDSILCYPRSFPC